jgi:multidrug resistance efflux pump
MNKTKAQEHLAEADRNIEKGKNQIRKQAARIKKLAADPYATEIAKETLRDFRKLQEAMEQHQKLTRKGITRLAYNGERRREPS